MITIKGIFKSLPTSGSLIVYMGITALSFLITSVVTVLVTGGDIEKVENLRIAQLIQSFGVFIFPPLIFAYLKDGNISNWLKFKKWPDFVLILLGILIVFVSVPAVNKLIAFNEMIVFPEYLKGFEKNLFDQEQKLKLITERMLEADSLIGLLRNLMLMALLPAIGEELFFRGGLQKMLSKEMNPHVAVLLTALIFSVFHMQFYGLIPRFFLGAVLGYLFLFSGNLWVPIIAHFVNNALAVISHYLLAHKMTSFNPEIPGKDGDVLLSLISFLLVVAFIFMIAFRQRSLKPGL